MGRREVLTKSQQKLVEEGKALYDWVELPKEFLDGLPDKGLPCIVCNSPTTKVLVPFSNGPYGGLIVATTEMPAYRCTQANEPCASDFDGPAVEYFSLNAIKSRLSLIRDLLVATSDTEGIGVVDAELQAADADH